ncbi:MAG: hypothetical protein AB8C95_01135 [Phycisphaeraceae bacterium]
MHCLTCGYDLQRLENPRCPECGRAFSPEHPASYGQPNTHRLLRWARYAGWTAAVIATGVGAASAIGISSGKHDMVLLIFYWLFGAVPLTIALMAYIACRSACKKWPSMRGFIVALILFTFNAGMVVEWPIYVSFFLHRDALNKQVQQAIQNPGSHIPPPNIGIFEIVGVCTKNSHGKNRVYFQISQNTNSPDFLVYNMSDTEIKSLFNVWSYRRLNANWHIVHED